MPIPTYDTYGDSGRGPSGPVDQLSCDSQSTSLGWYTWDIYNWFPFVKPWVVHLECIQSVLESVNNGSWYNMFKQAFPIVDSPMWKGMGFYYGLDSFIR